ncbi:MAG TPA: ATP-binding protein [Pseudonocardiaceae bacterium]|nr:ATP-binding protein [Pseudonocardiaceae bacterium]
MQSENDGMGAGTGQRALDGATRHHDTRKVLAGVVVFLRLVAVPPIVVAIASGVRLGSYAVPWLAVLVYLLFTAWGTVFVLVVWRAGKVPGWVVATDVAVVTACILLISLAVHPVYFNQVDGSDLEAAMEVSAVVVAMNTGIRKLIAACLVLGAAHVVAEIPTMIAYAGDIGATITDILWLAGTALISALISSRLLAADDRAEAANREVSELHAQAAEARARSQERVRYLREQIRRYRALHDGPLSILTAIASGGLDHHDEEVRRQCAVSANLLRGLISDDPMSTLTDLSIALTKAGSDYAVHGLRVHYQFSDLPPDLPPSVVEAMSWASREALNNIALHAGTDRAWLTARADGGENGHAVTVTIVDQGKGFDPAHTRHGRGLSDSITGRMADVGGAAAVDSMLGQGTRVELRWQR